jgi:WD40 repeat protein
MLISHTFTSIVDLGKEAYIEDVLGDKACFSADGRYLFTADTTGRVIRYKTPEVGDEIEWKDMNVSYSYGVRSLSTHPEGGQLIIGTCYTRGKVDLYDLEQHEISRSVDGRYSAIRGLHFLGEGGAFLVVEDPSILVYRESRSGRCAAISLAHTQIGEHFLGTEDGRFHYSPGTEETAVIRDGEKIFTPKERPDLVDHSLPERLRTLINSSP